MGKRGRKKEYIQKLTGKDEKMLKALRACGYITRDMAKQNLSMSEHRVQNFIRDGYLEKIGFSDVKNQKIIDTFRLTKSGERLIEKKFGLRNCYRSSSISHDLEVAKIYMNCSETERETWKTESELREQFQELLTAMREQDRFDEYDRLQSYLEQNEISAVDGSYISDETGIEESAEVITDSYGREEIAAKVTFCHIMNIHQK